jgi:hypothetical protein
MARKPPRYIVYPSTNADRTTFNPDQIYARYKDAPIARATALALAGRVEKGAVVVDSHTMQIVFRSGFGKDWAAAIQ